MLSTDIDTRRLLAAERRAQLVREAMRFPVTPSAAAVRAEPRRTTFRKLARLVAFAVPFV
jgi:hypothetical protein